MTTTLVSATEEAVVLSIVGLGLALILMALAAKCFMDKFRIDVVELDASSKGGLPLNRYLTASKADGFTTTATQGAPARVPTAHTSVQLVVPQNTVHHGPVEGRYQAYPVTPNPYISNQRSETRQQPHLHPQLDNRQAYVPQPGVTRPAPLSTPGTSLSGNLSKETETGDSRKSVTENPRPPKRPKQEAPPPAAPVLIKVPTSDHENDQISDVADMMAINQISSDDATRTRYPEPHKPYRKPMPVSAEAIIPLDPSGALKPADDALMESGILSKEQIDQRNTNYKKTSAKADIISSRNESDKSKSKVYVPVKSDTDQSDKKEPPSKGDDRDKVLTPKSESSPPEKKDSNVPRGADNTLQSPANNSSCKLDAKEREQKSGGELSVNPSDREIQRGTKIQLQQNGSPLLQPLANVADRNANSGVNTDVTQVTDSGAVTPKKEEPK